MTFGVLFEEKQTKKGISSLFSVAKKFLVPNDVRVFSEEEVTRRESCRFVFFSSSQPVFSVLGPRIQFGHLSSSASHSEPSQAIFQTKKIAAQKERARTLFEFFFVCLFATIRERTTYTRAERATRRSLRSAATLFARARARCKFKPVKVLFFFQTITF